MPLDRNANDVTRLRRNAQRGKTGSITATVAVTAPLQNTGTAIQLNLLAAGGLTSSSQQLTLKLDAGGTALSLSASGLKYTSPVTTKGDLLGFDTVPKRVPVGSNTQVLTADSTAALGLKWAAVPVVSPLTTKGDLYGFSTTNARLPVGADTQVLTADSTATLGVKWAAATGGGLTAANFVSSETPSGTVNGSNSTFTLANTPTTGTLRFFINGVRMAPTTDYTLSAGTITTNTAPATGATLLADYMK